MNHLNLEYDPELFMESLNARGVTTEFANHIIDYIADNATTNNMSNKENQNPNDPHVAREMDLYRSDLSIIRNYRTLLRSRESWKTTTKPAYTPYHPINNKKGASRLPRM